MPDPFLGQLALVPYNFAPKGWAFCNGQLLPINQNQALFALLGTSYGGNGQTTFALPDLRGRVPISAGQGPELESYALGQMGGSERVALTTGEVPALTHAPDLHSGKTQVGKGKTSGCKVANTGSGQAHENRQPYLALNWIIALEGEFPSHP
jgi:microcystin-dependent protein